MEVSGGTIARVAFWKNNSFTQAAIEGDKLMHELKNEGKEDNTLNSL